MNAQPDVADMHRNGTLPRDPFAGDPYVDAPSDYETDPDVGTDEPVSSVHQVAVTPATVIASWRNEGPLLHEPTGIASLDNATGGGPVYGSRWYLLGAPDAGKTAVLVQIADVYARRGILVGYHAVDEEPSDVVTRLAQRAGWARHELERRDAGDLDLVAERLSDLPIRLYDATTTIDAAMADLAAEAKRRGMRAAYLVDSIQTVPCRAEAESRSVREVVTARVVAMRHGATLYRMIAIAASEMGRHAYRSSSAAEEASDLAAAKESGAIEYSARVLVAFRSVSGEPDLVQARIGKNKHGPSGGEFYMRLDRRRMTLTETTDIPVEPDADQVKADKDKRKTNADAALVAVVLASAPGISRRDLGARLRADHGSFSNERVETGLAVLSSAVCRSTGGTRGAHALYLDGREVPESIVAILDGSDRAAVIVARPPTQTNAVTEAAQ